tara:strand:+ start:428 stop:1468 length:1041 start_codon:yes stop_codon:yes gene_type:complete
MDVKKLIYLTPLFIIFFGINNYNLYESQILFANVFETLPKNQWLHESPIQFFIGYILNKLINNVVLTYWIVVVLGYCFLMFGFYCIQQKKPSKKHFIYILFFTPFFLIIFSWSGKPDTFLVGALLLLFIYNKNPVASFLITLTMVFSHPQISIVYYVLIKLLKIFDVKVHHIFSLVISLSIHSIYIRGLDSYDGGRLDFILENWDRYFFGVFSNFNSGILAMFMWIWIPIIISELFFQKKFLLSLIFISVISFFALDFTRTFVTMSVPLIYSLSSNDSFIKSFNKIFSSKYLLILGFLQFQKRPGGIIVDSAWSWAFVDNYARFTGKLSTSILDIILNIQKNFLEQ